MSHEDSTETVVAMEDCVYQTAQIFIGNFMAKVEWSKFENFEKIQGTAFYTNATTDHVEAEIHGLITGEKYFCRSVSGK